VAGLKNDNSSNQQKNDFGFHSSNLCGELNTKTPPLNTIYKLICPILVLLLWRIRKTAE